jgi:hypothetical protein
VPLVPNPILVEDLASLRPDAAPGAGPAPTVERALRDILGATPARGDGAAFLAALERSFTVTEPASLNGRAPAGEIVPVTTDGRVWTWSPRGYALQADMGSLAGAQASIYRRAQLALEESLPLLDGLEPLIPFEDEEAVAAARGVVRSELQRVVQELGREGGPSVGLIDQLLESLVGQPPAPPPPPSAPRIPADAVGGHLGDLREHFGLNRALINTIEEEQNFTNFLVLSDYVTGLWAEWSDQRPSFLPGGPVFFGTQLVLISRELQVASESVREVYAALDTVLIGEGERATLTLQVGGANVLLGSLLEWADHFLTVDARELIESAGRQGALSLEATLVALEAQVAAFQAAAVPDGSGLPPNFPLLFANVVVHSTLTALRGSLTNLLNQVGALQPPQPVIGFPLQPPAVQQPPFVAGVRLAIDTATFEHVVTVTGANLDQAEVVFSVGGTIVQQVPVVQRVSPFPGAFDYEARVPQANLPAGTYEVFIALQGAHWLIEDAYVVP